MKTNYQIIKSAILQRLRNDLSKDLTYHTPAHTLYVLKNAERIARSEHISSKEDLFLLRVACLYHDSGFLFTYTGHEEASCNLVQQELPAFDVNQSQREIICGLIMATKIPQTPHTKLEEIMCDADLDYLGTDDFFAISDTLFMELKNKGFVSTKREWDAIQINFIREHRYFTTTSKSLREEKKLIHLGIIESGFEADKSIYLKGQNRLRK